jgi:dolichyl-phosphate-mannose-protein mannosyltransferase
MRPPAITVDFGAPDSDTPTRSSSEFEEISYPPNHNWSASHNEEELPLHYMTEEKARRRVVRGPGTAGVFGSATDGVYGDYDDEGKDVYNKPRHVQNRIGSGRLPQPLSPPPTTIVSFLILGAYHV